MTVDYLYKKFQSSTNEHQGQLLKITKHLIVRDNITKGGISPGRPRKDWSNSFSSINRLYQPSQKEEGEDMTMQLKNCVLYTQYIFPVILCIQEHQHHDNVNI
jgi:hypothetical protein